MMVTVSLATSIYLRNLIILVLEHLVKFFGTLLSIFVILMDQNWPHDELIEAFDVFSASFFPFAFLSILGLYVGFSGLVLRNAIIVV